MKQVSQTSGIEDQEAEAARRLAGALDPSMIDALLADEKITGTPIDGVDGLLNRMTKTVIERALQAEMILSLYARGLSTRDIEAHLPEVYGVAASRELISNITDVVVDEIGGQSSARGRHTDVRR